MALIFSSPNDSHEVWRNELHKYLPDLDFRVWPDGVGDVAEIELAMVWKPEKGMLKRFPNLKVIFSLGAGVDHLISDPELPPDVPIVRLVDSLLTAGMTEYVVWAVLHCHREIQEFVGFQRECRWQQLPAPDTETRRVGIMGLGVLGGDAARKLRDFGFPVAGWDIAHVAIDGVETFRGKDAFVPFLERTDILVSLLPLTPATEGIIDRTALASLPEGAYVVNSARGAHIVEDELLAALDSGHVAGAVLDVFRREPLPAEHAFWRHPRVLVTPHIASLTIPRSAAAVYAEHISRFQDGLAPTNVVDMTRGF